MNRLEAALVGEGIKVGAGGRSGGYCREILRDKGVMRDEIRGEGAR